jgi:hypothetical protein
MWIYSPGNMAMYLVEAYLIEHILLRNGNGVSLVTFVEKLSTWLFQMCSFVSIDAPFPSVEVYFSQ